MGNMTMAVLQISCRFGQRKNLENRFTSVEVMNKYRMVCFWHILTVYVYVYILTFSGWKVASVLSDMAFLSISVAFKFKVYYNIVVNEVKTTITSAWPIW